MSRIQPRKLPIDSRIRCVIFALLLPLTLLACDFTVPDGIPATPREDQVPSPNRAPAIQSVNGSGSDGADITLLGVRFGTHDLNIETSEGWLEQATNGRTIDETLRSGWRSAEASAIEPFVDDTRAHTGTKSIKAMFRDPNWASGIRYDAGAEFGEVYVSFWVYFDPFAGEGGQWKIWRLNPTGGSGTNENEIMSSSWYERDHTNGQFYTFIYCRASGVDGLPCYPDGDNRLRWLGPPEPPAHQWFRMEIYARESSTPGARDGTLRYSLHQQSGPVSVLADWDGNILTRESPTSARWRHFVWQGYWGNGDRDGGQGADNMDTWYDDIYFQVGSRARVEIGDAPTWDSCTHREVQVPSAWSDDSITLTVKHGSFAAGQTVYAYVINENGDVSNGHTLVLR